MAQDNLAPACSILTRRSHKTQAVWPCKSFNQCSCSSAHEPRSTTSPVLLPTTPGRHVPTCSYSKWNYNHRGRKRLRYLVLTFPWRIQFRTPCAWREDTSLTLTSCSRLVASSKPRVTGDPASPGGEVLKVNLVH